MTSPQDPKPSPPPAPYEPPAIVWEQEFVALALYSVVDCTKPENYGDPTCQG